MGKQDPYCAARLGKEAKKTNTDRRGGQTPRWDQELRFTVHDSPDYHQLKVSVFNDDKKTELIGETFVSLESVITPGGGQSDTWHGLNCKGKYAGEIRIELTYYDTRPKEEKPVTEKRKESARPDGKKPGVSGPRENTPVKRRPLPSDPTGASPSPANTPEHRGLQGVQAGPRGYPTPPRQQRGNEPVSTPQRRDQGDTPQRRPISDASPLNGTPSSNPHTPQHQQYAPRPVEQNVYTPPNPRSSNSNLLQHGQDGFDMSYTAPKPYEAQAADSPSHLRELSGRAMSQDNFRSSPAHHPNTPADLPHSHSAPIVPTNHTYEPDSLQQDPYHVHHSPQPNGYSQDPYQDPAYQVEPLRLSRNSRSNEQMVLHSSYQSQNSYMEQADPYSQFASQGRRASAMQPTVEDEDDVPPPPPMHRSNASTIPQPYQQAPDYHGDSPAPLNSSRHREESPQYGYDSPPEPYSSNDYGQPHHQERRYTHPRPDSRPVSRDTMAPSPLRNETIALPASLVAGVNASRLRQLSEPDYRTPLQYESPSQPHPLSHQQSAPPSNALQYYQHPPPEEPHRRSPVQDPAPIIKPRAMSPAVSPIHAPSPGDERASRMPARSMPTRKSVSPRPPPPEEPEQMRRLSGVPFDPDSFDVFNPSVKPASTSTPERPGSSMEMNDKGQIVTFNGRVIDASDHLPIDSWAPEPERKNEKERPTRTRPVLSGARDLEAAKQREEKYRRDREERDRIRTAANTTLWSMGGTSNALVTSRHDFGNRNSPVNAGALVLADRDATPPSSGRNRLQKRSQRPITTSTYESPTHSSPGIPMPNANILRERENLGGYGSSPSYGRDARHSVAAPPIPAKIPLERGAEDMTALSLELQSIDIGPGSGGRRPKRGTARRYGF
ncbi:hypothetical protein CC80DRAFT_426601 [Byssothecium circinans]|uniref:C2 domain-containing protein n=1 Tax=Byssothecium circinans TaxID=147558 RepID=A0A6A5TEI9_9PLEO|nr:hypothetical protein CC80DRAFT_426601 [Byssothecium circinans]